MKKERLITDKSFYNALNCHCLQAFVMGVRWLRAVASFILLKTKKGRDYITLNTFNAPITATIATTPIIIFLVVKIVVEAPLLFVLFALAVPVYSFNRKSDIWKVCPLTTVSTNTFAGAFGIPAGVDFLTPSIISPVLKDFTIVPPVAPPDVMETLPVRIVYGCVNIYFAIIILLKFICKYTNNFVDATTFYGFAEVRGLFVFNKIKFPITFSGLAKKPI